MTEVAVFDLDGAQALTRPDDLRFKTESVNIRREGDRVILEPVSPDLRTLSREAFLDCLKSVQVELGPDFKAEGGEQPIPPPHSA